MRRLALVFVLLAACGSDPSGDARGPALTVRIGFGSHLPIAGLDVQLGWAPDGRVELQRPVPPYVGPPATRSLSVSIPLPPEAASAPALSVDVVGRSEDGRAVAEGQSIVDVGAPRQADITLEPVRRARCGDGRLEPPEQCDDGNTVDGDGCDAACREDATVGPDFIRAGWTSLSTATVAFSEVAAVPLDPGADRLVFVSGALSASEGGGVGLQLRVDGRVVDELGHQVNGDPETSGAGFMTFELIRGADVARRLTLHLRAAAGTAYARGVRVVAARIPAGAEVVRAGDDRESRRTGLDFELERLALSPARAGRYWVLAKMSMSEAPSTRTARGWLELPDGQRRPEGPPGVTFSAPRPALVPMFTQTVLDVPVGGAELRLRGRSSGSETAPADWGHPTATTRRRVRFVDGAPAGYALRVVFDHARDVAEGRSLPDGSDVAVVYAPLGEPPRGVHRVLDPESGWNRADTTVWFRVDDAVVTADETTYALYFGGTDEVLDDPLRVFGFFDDFEGSSLDPELWAVSAPDAVSVGEGALTLRGAAALTARVAAGTARTRWEAKLRLTSAEPEGLAYFAVGRPAADRFEGGAFAYVGGHQAQTQLSSQALTLATPTDDHTYAITRDEAQTMVFAQDGATVASLPIGVPLAQGWSVSVVNEGVEGAVYDWVRVRSFHVPEPTIELAAAEGTAGTDPSDFRFRKLVAVRLDAWPASYVAQSDQVVRTQDSYVSAASLALPAGNGHRLAVQSVRVAGADAVCCRRRGEVRIGGEILVATGHRIDRDDRDETGYHHVAGRAHVVSSTVATTLDVGVASPEAIDVIGADGRIVVLEYSR